MRTVLLAFVFFIPVLSMALPFPMTLQGDFKFADVEAGSVRHYERVYTGTAAGKSRLQELKSQKYLCESQTSLMHLCSVFAEDRVLPVSLANKLRQDNQNSTFSFEKAQELEIESVGESVQQWLVKQQVRKDAQSWNTHRYTVMPDLLKMTPMSDGKLESFNWLLNSQDHIIETMNYSEMESKDRWTRYFIYLHYKKSL